MSNVGDFTQVHLFLCCQQPFPPLLPKLSSSFFSPLSLWSSSSFLLRAHGRRYKNMKFSTLKQHRIFLHAHVDSHLSVDQPEGLRGFLCTLQRLRGSGQDTDTPVLMLPPPSVLGPDAACPLSLWKALRLGQGKGRGEGRWSHSEDSFPRVSLAEAYPGAPGPLCCLTLGTTERAKEMRKKQCVLLRPD